jgi:predicted nucleic acid-binding protein
MTAAAGPASPSLPEAFVVDASVAVKLFLEEPLAAEARALFARLASPRPVALHAPDLLYVECANVLWKYVRRFGYDPALAAANIADLAALDVAAVPARSLAGHTLEIAASVGITAYDACYAALAEAVGCALLSADERLVEQLAARGTPVRWLGDYGG